MLDGKVLCIVGPVSIPHFDHASGQSSAGSVHWLPRHLQEVVGAVWGSLLGVPFWIQDFGPIASLLSLFFICDPPNLLEPWAQ